MKSTEYCFPSSDGDSSLSFTNELDTAKDRFKTQAEVLERSVADVKYGEVFMNTLLTNTSFVVVMKTN